MHTVKVVRDRTDFRAFIDLLYGPNRNVDTDGTRTLSVAGCGASSMWQTGKLMVQA